MPLPALLSERIQRAVQNLNDVVGEQAVIMTPGGDIAIITVESNRYDIQTTYGSYEIKRANNNSTNYANFGGSRHHHQRHDEDEDDDAKLVREMSERVQTLFDHAEAHFHRARALEEKRNYGAAANEYARADMDYASIPYLEYSPLKDKIKQRRKECTGKAAYIKSMSLKPIGY